MFEKPVSADSSKIGCFDVRFEQRGKQDPSIAAHYVCSFARKGNIRCEGKFTNILLLNNKVFEQFASCVSKFSNVLVENKIH